MKIYNTYNLLNEGLDRMLLEDIEAVRKQYPKISNDDFDKLIRLDPTFNENRDSVGTYGKWILNLFNKGKLDNIGHVKDLLVRFEENKKYLLNKDINKFKSLEEVDAYLNNENNYKEKSHRQSVRDNQRARRNADIDNDLVFSGDGFDVYVPSSYANSCKLGQGTNWCTASTETDTYYNMYKNKYGGDYYILINQSNPKEKYQFHFESNQFMDKSDNDINYIEFLNNHKNLFNFFKKLYPNDVFSPEEVENFTYTGKRIPDRIRPHIKYIDISDSVIEIGDVTSDGCKSLQSISIPNSVTKIGEFAFEFCKSLQSISIPSSVTVIGDFAFYRCTSLSSISIPNLVTEIGWHAFDGCTSLSSISIPNSVTKIGEGAFRKCTSLKPIKLPRRFEWDLEYIGIDENQTEVIFI